MHMLACLCWGLRDHPKRVFRWLHRNLVEKDSGALLDRTRMHWYVATQAVQSKDFVSSRANRRDHIPLSSPYTSSGTAVCVGGWTKGICCPWTGAFVVESPFRHTKYFRYLSRRLLETLPPVSVSNLIPYLMKSRLGLFTISLRFSCRVAVFPKSLLCFLHQFNFTVMPFHKILIELCLASPPFLRQTPQFSPASLSSGSSFSHVPALSCLIRYPSPFALFRPSLLTSKALVSPENV